VRSYGQYCGVARALDAVGDRWNLLIVRELLLRGPCRYTDLQHGLPGIATNLLAERLRDLEAVGVVSRQAAPPPVATTLFELTESGRELEPVLRALGRWGSRFMGESPEGDAFRVHWLAFPVAEYWVDNDPEAGPLSIAVHTGEEAAVIEASGGQLDVRLGPAQSPDLVLSGDPQTILGLLVGRLSPAEARRRGLRSHGDIGLLRRFRPEHRPPASVRLAP